MKFGLLHDARFVAALLVVGFHASLNLNKPKYFGESADALATALWFAGDAGVAFFFVLSGFIIQHVHGADVGRPERLRHYLVRRLVRIYPAYWIVFVGTWCAASLFPDLRSSLPHAPDVLLKSLLLWPQDAAVVGGTGAPLIVVAWSLQYELMFYALMALAIVNVRLGALAGTGVLVCVALHWVSGDDRFPLRFVGSHHMLMFAAGMVTAVWVKRSAPSRHAGWWLAIGLLGFFATGVVSTWMKPVYVREWADMAYSLTGSVAIVGLVDLDRARPAKACGVLPPVLGDASYVLYLIHFPLVSALSKGLSLVLAHTPVQAGLALLLTVVACVAASVVFHRCVERPVARWLNRQLLSTGTRRAQGAS